MLPAQQTLTDNSAILLVNETSSLLSYAILYVLYMLFCSIQAVSKKKGSSSRRKSELQPPQV